MNPILNKIEDIIDNFSTNDIRSKGYQNKYLLPSYERMFWHYHPSTGKFFFEGNPSYSFEYESASHASQYPIIMLKDGWLGVLSFFLRFPKPWASCDSVVLIHEDFESLIPRHWQGLVGLYRVNSKKENHSRVEKVIIFGNTAFENYYLTSFDESMKKLKSKVKAATEVICYIQDRDSLLCNSAKKEDLILFVKEILKEYGISTFIELNFPNNFEQSLKSEEHYYLNLDQSNLLIKENYLEHVLMARQGISILGNTSKEKSVEHIKYDLSLYHTITIFEPKNIENHYGDFYITAKKSVAGIPTVESLYNNTQIMKSIKEIVNNG